MIKMLKKAAGPGIIALIDYCRSVDEKIAGRKLSQLKPAAAPRGHDEMPKAYSIGVASYFASVITLFYTFLISYICLAVAVKTLPGGWSVIAGFILFILLTLANSGVTKGRTFSLRWFVVTWFVLSVCNLLVAGWLIFASFSWLSFSLWGVSAFLLWLARLIMNGPELTKLMKWRVSLRAAAFRRQALTHPERK